MVEAVEVMAVAGNHQRLRRGMTIDVGSAEIAASVRDGADNALLAAPVKLNAVDGIGLTASVYRIGVRYEDQLVFAS